jgi:exodeoxyribonuclease VII large subunit
MHRNRYILSVSELNAEVNLLLKQSFPVIWLEGEISNLARPASGHLYFSLKDAASQVRCAMFRPYARNLRLSIAQGTKVLVRARINVYEPRGDYQLIVEQMQNAGQGRVQYDYEQLKKQLHDQGLFEQKHKYSLPRYPKHIGIISSPTGAAIQDILTVLKRRAPHIPITVYPITVQGDKAAADIVYALHQAADQTEHNASKENHCDVLILARGGGSIEDLWAFNQEAVAQAIHQCTLPIITGIGHEIDFTIADCIADKRAATPSAAAELVSPKRDTLQSKLQNLQQQLQYNLHLYLDRQQQAYQRLNARLQHCNPHNQLKQQHLRLALLEQNLYRCAKRHLRQKQQQLQQCVYALQQHSPEYSLAIKNTQLQYSQQQLLEKMQALLQTKAVQLQLLVSRLNSVNPLSTLERGYSISQDAITGELIQHQSQVKLGQKIRVLLQCGEFIARVE